MHLEHSALHYHSRQCQAACSSICDCDWTRQLASPQDIAGAKLLLASSSAYRAQLLQRLNHPFLSVSPDVDETANDNEPPDTLALRLATDKAQAVMPQPNPAILIIGSDQVASVNGRRLHKPGNRTRAIEQLMQMRGQAITFFTGLCVRHAESGERFTSLDSTVARLRMLSVAEIERYVDLDSPLDCAGSFKVESLGISLFESVSSDDPTALIGLPLIALCRGVRQFGLAVP